jgi:hypothetical protein
MERSVEILAQELLQLEKRAADLKGDIDLADFLHQCERLRRELKNYSQAEAVAGVLNKLENLITETLEKL